MPEVCLLLKKKKKNQCISAVILISAALTWWHTVPLFSGDAVCFVSHDNTATCLARVRGCDITCGMRGDDPTWFFEMTYELCHPQSNRTRPPFCMTKQWKRFSRFVKAMQDNIIELHYVDLWLFFHPPILCASVDMGSFRRWSDILSLWDVKWILFTLSVILQGLHNSFGDQVKPSPPKTNHQTVASADVALKKSRDSF